MLYIENIDAYSVRFGNGYGGGTYPRVLPKTLQARSDTLDPSRVWIWHTQNNECFVNGMDVDYIKLNNTSYATAGAFVEAFNALMEDSTAFTTTTTTTIAATTTTTIA